MNIGYCINQECGNETIMKSGANDFKGTPGKEGISYQKYMSWLKGMVAKYEIDTIVFEDVAGAWKGREAMRYYYGFRTITIMVAQFYNLRIYSYYPGTLKKSATGSGRAKKEQVIECIKKLYPDMVIRTDDQADAVSVIHHHLSVTT